MSVELAPYTELANAERIVEWYGDRLRRVEQWNTWLRYDGRRWVSSPTAGREFAIDVGHQLLDTMRAMALPSEDLFSRWAIRSCSNKVISATAALAADQASLRVAAGKLDRRPMLLNVSNGTIDLETGKLRPHDRNDLLTKLAPVRFDPHAECPEEWSNFLSRVTDGDEELETYLQRIAGYSLTGLTREHALFVFFGEGANGKSTFINTLCNILGPDYSGPAPRGLLFQRSIGEAHPTERACLFGKRLVTVTEPNKGQTLDEGTVKQLSSEDPIDARRMREDFWSFDPTHKLVLATNHRPLIKGDDEGIWRRIRLVPWSVRIPKEERDPDLAAKLYNERDGILQWAVRGARYWHLLGLGEPSCVTAATDAYRDDQDPLGDFFADRCDFASDTMVARKDLRAAYERYADENGIRHRLNPKDFAARLRARGVSGENANGNPHKTKVAGMPYDAWKGIGLRDPSDSQRRPLAVVG